MLRLSLCESASRRGTRSSPEAIESRPMDLCLELGRNSQTLHLSHVYSEKSFGVLRHFFGRDGVDIELLDALLKKFERKKHEL